MKKIFKSIFAVFMIAVLSMTLISCGGKKEQKKTDKNVKTSTAEVKDEVSDKTEDKAENKKEEAEVPLAETDEQSARTAFSDYVSAAKKLDFKTMNKYIPGENTLPILESYRKAYSKYNISESRIEELCKARLATFSVSPISSIKSGENVIVTAKIMTVNMELLQNKWLETLCNKYPEYASLSEEEMTAENVDVLIQVMIDVLKKAEPTEESKKDFVLTPKNGSWIIGATSEEIFPSN